MDDSSRVVRFWCLLVPSRRRLRSRIAARCVACDELNDGTAVRDWTWRPTQLNPSTRARGSPVKRELSNVWDGQVRDESGCLNKGSYSPALRAAILLRSAESVQLTRTGSPRRRQKIRLKRCIYIRYIGTSRRPESHLVHYDTSLRARSLQRSHRAAEAGVPHGRGRRARRRRR